MRAFVHQISVSIFILCFASISLAQEQLMPLSGNMDLIKRYNPKSSPVKKTQAISALDTIPFFEDFYYAYKSPYPNFQHWMDSNVYVNTGFAIAPVSIGVATFDGLNKHGYPYSLTAPIGSSAGADTLTSRPINLKYKGLYLYSPADSVYLSFYYQAKGNGDPPEASDSLCVEFYKPHQKLWNKVWGVKGYNPGDSAFYYVMLPVSDTAYFDTTFQFRFRNKATLSGSLDHWHVDYIRMDKGRTLHEDTTYSDLTFAYMPSPLLKNYSAMPYEQFTNLEMAPRFSNFIRNNFSTQIQETYGFNVYYQNNVSTFYSVSKGAFDLDPFSAPLHGYQDSTEHRHPSTNFFFTNPMPDTTYYTLRHVLFRSGTGSSDRARNNDTVVQVQRFSNYYAYDDGTAEVGYYVNTYGAKVAQRFTLNVTDTLRAVDIFFDPVTQGSIIEGSPFRITIWADGGSGPSNTRILQDSSMYPTYIAWGYNTIPRYLLTSYLKLTAGTYYVGIQQETNQALNIGFDKNNNHMSALYYDIGFGWTQSAIPGSLMIHPVFGKNSLVVTGIDEKTRPVARPKEFQLYPNPAQDKVYINRRDDRASYSRVEILSALGQPVFTESYTDPDRAIDISNLENGIYFIYLSTSNARSAPEKLIISR